MNNDQFKSIKQMGIANLILATLTVALSLTEFAAHLCVLSFKFLYEHFLYFVPSKVLIYLSFLSFIISCSLLIVLAVRIAYVRFKRCMIKRTVSCATYR